MSYLKNKFLHTIFLSFTCLYCLAQTDNTKHNAVSLSGKITDAKTGQALPGATISIQDLNKGSISKDDGTYSMTNIPAGKYVVEVSYVGYSSNAQTIDIRSAVQHDFTLQQTAVEQEAVIVTGVSSATRIKQNPQPVVSSSDRIL